MRKYLILAILLMPLASVTFAQTSAIWNGKADTDWYNDSEVEFTITTSQQLAGFAKLVNSGNDFKGKTLKLATNIMLNDTTGWKNWASRAPANTWTPIGTRDSNQIFNGTFEGSGYVISGAYINNTSNGQGLFRNVDSVGVIKNLGVIASYIKGNEYIGGLVGGMNFGVISNSYFTGVVEGTNTVGGIVCINFGSISNSYSTGTVTELKQVWEDDYVLYPEGRWLVEKNEIVSNIYFIGAEGGLVGVNIGKINNSYSTSTVTGTGSVGGLVGSNNEWSNIIGDINNSYSTGIVNGDESVGGLVGVNIGKINNSYSTSNVTGTRSVGGLVGLNNELSMKSSKGSISNSYSTGTVRGNESVGGLVGRNDGGLEERNDKEGKIISSYSTGMVVGKNNVGGLVGGSMGKSKIVESYSTAEVLGETLVGGIIGSQSQSGVISDSYFIGVVGGTYMVGGIVGFNSGKINNSYSVVTGKENTPVSWLVGENMDNNRKIVYDKEGKISNSYLTGTAPRFAAWEALSLFSQNNKLRYSNSIKTPSQMKQKGTFKGWDFNKTWGINSEINNGYPYLLENK